MLQPESMILLGCLMAKGYEGRAGRGEFLLSYIHWKNFHYRGQKKANDLEKKMSLMKIIWLRKTYQ